MSDLFGNISIKQTPKAPSSLKGQPENRNSKSNKPRGRRTRSSRSSKIPLLSFILILLLSIGYCTVGFFGVPTYIESVLFKESSDKFNVQVRAEAISFNPFSLTLIIDKLTITEQERIDNIQNSFALKTLHTRFNLNQLLQGELVTEFINLNNPQLTIVKDSDSLNNESSTPLSKYGATFQNFFANANSLFPNVIFNNISLTGGSVFLQDHRQTTVHTIQDIDFSLPVLSRLQGQNIISNTPKISATVNGSPVQLTGDFFTDTDGNDKTVLSCSFHNADLSQYSHYIFPSHNRTLSKGLASGEITLTFSPYAITDKLTIGFDLILNDADIVESGIGIILTPKTLAKGTLKPTTKQITFETLTLDSPSLSSPVPVQEIILNLMVPQASNEMEQTGSLLDISIEKLTVQHGTFQFPSSEKKISSWSDIQLQLTNYNTLASELSDSQQETKFSVEASSNNKESLSFEGYLNRNGLPEGDFQLKAPSAKYIASTLGLPVNSIKSDSAEFNAHLSFQRDNEQPGNINYFIGNGSASLTNLQISEKGDIWYQGDKVHLTGIEKDANLLFIGQTFSEGSVINIYNGESLALWQNLINQDNSFAINSIDFAGKFSLFPAEKGIEPLRFNNISLQAIDLSRKTKKSNKANLSFKSSVSNHGAIQGKGRIELSPFSLRVESGFSQLESDTLLPWLSKDVQFIPPHSTISGKGSISLPDMSYSGNLVVKNHSRLQHSDLKNRLSWQSATFSELRFNQRPFYFGSNICILQSPKVNHTFTDETGAPTNFFLKEIIDTFQVNEKKSKNNSSLGVEIAKVEFSDGTATLTDKRYSPPLVLDVNSLKGVITNLSMHNSDERMHYAITGGFGAGSFLLEGESRIGGKSEEISELTFEKLPLSLFEKQLANRVGIKPDTSFVSGTVQTERDKQKRTRQSQLSFSNLQPSTGDNETADILAIKKDEQGIFRLNTKQSTKNGTRLTPLLDSNIAEFQKLVTRNAISPLMILDKEARELLGKEFAEFQPGKILLSDNGRASLTQFSKLLSKQPKLGLAIIGNADLTIDGRAMRQDLQAIEEQRVAEENLRREKLLQDAMTDFLNNPPKLDPDDPFDMIPRNIPMELHRKYSPIEPQMISIDKEMLLELANQRAKVIRDIFINQLAINPERVTITEHSNLVDSTALPGNRVTFAIRTLLNR